MRVLSCLLLFLLLPAGIMAAERPDPEELRQELLKNPWLHKSSGEGFCWHFASGASSFLKAYEAWGDPEWLAAAERHYDWALEQHVKDDPDGYPGTIGGPFDNNRPGAAPIVDDTVVGDGLVGEVLTHWAELVLNGDDPELEKRFGDKARSYVTIAERMCYDKLDHRGVYYEDRIGYGSYHTYPKAIERKSWEWVPHGGKISDNLNKHYTNGKVLLRLWRITGKEKYKKRVIAIYSRHKALRRYYPDEDRVVWNFWMPHGPYDIDGNAPQSWVSVHPKRAGYQSGETSDFMEVYESGLVFDKRDVEMIVNTNKFMRSKNWIGADGISKAGTLWSALAPYDETLRKEVAARVAKGSGRRGAINKAHFENVVMKDLGFERSLMPEGHKAEVSEVKLQPGVKIWMALTIPNTVQYKADKRVRLASKVHGSGLLKIELMDESGNKVLGTIAEREMKSADSFFSPLWDGTNPASGKKEDGRYTVRWTFNGEQRTWPVWVEPGEAADDDRVADLKPGDSISVDFEDGRLSERWEVGRNAEISDAQVHGGQKSLKITGGEHELILSRYEDLPVKISLWAWDNGVKRGKKNGAGSGVGVRVASGDKFAVRQYWRPYFNGDKEYIWLNTGENKWFTGHRSGINRSKGWHHWVFDFTGEQAQISMDGQSISPGNLKPPQFVPKGAARLFLIGGAGDLYVDDIEITFPR